jgi:hypothetical protein
MLSDKLLDELRQLSPPEKLRVVQILVNDLAAEAANDLSLFGTHYEVWSPYDSPGAAETLLKMLDDERQTPDA